MAPFQRVQELSIARYRADPERLVCADGFLEAVLTFVVALPVADIWQVTFPTLLFVAQCSPVNGNDK